MADQAGEQGAACGECPIDPDQADQAGERGPACVEGAIELTEKLRANLAASGDVSEGPYEAAHHVPGADEIAPEPITSPNVVPGPADSPIAGAGFGIAGEPSGSESIPMDVVPARVVNGVLGVDRTHDPDFLDTDEPVAAGHGRALPGDRSAETHAG